MEHPLRNENHYLFFKEDGANIAYFFKTNYDVEYKVIFKPSPYIFGDDKPYASLLFEFSVLAKFAGPQSYIRDDMIAPTVAVIFLDFYNRQDENTCFYICDSSDGRQHVRKRKFEQWFAMYNAGRFIKFDEIIIDTDGTAYPVSVILTRNNPFLIEIFNAFISLIDHYNDEK